jgi:hypothetical protein
MGAFLIAYLTASFILAIGPFACGIGQVPFFNGSAQNHRVASFAIACSAVFIGILLGSLALHRRSRLLAGVGI